MGIADIRIEKESVLIERTRLELAKFRSISIEDEWLANINSVNTRRAYRTDIAQFNALYGISNSEQFRSIERPHVIAFREQLKASGASSATIRRKLAALSSLFDYLCDKNAVSHNPVDGTKRPKRDGSLSKTPTMEDREIRDLLEVVTSKSIRQPRDRAIITTMAFGALRIAEVAAIQCTDIRLERGQFVLRVRGKGEKGRDVPLHPQLAQAIDDYLKATIRDLNHEGPLFLNHRKKSAGMTIEGIYKLVKRTMRRVGISNNKRMAAHALRKTAATNALEHGADITEVKDWLGHSDISTTQVYDGRSVKLENSPTYKVRY